MPLVRMHVIVHDGGLRSVLSGKVLCGHSMGMCPDRIHVDMSLLYDEAAFFIRNQSKAQSLFCNCPMHCVPYHFEAQKQHIPQECKSSLNVHF